MKKIILISSIILILFSFVGVVIAHEHEHGKISVSNVERIQVYPSVTKLHPPTTHFAIAFPALLLLVEIVYVILRRKPDILEFILVIAATGGVLLATASGLYIYFNMQEPEVKEAYEIFELHELLGIILGIVFVVIFTLRVLYEFIKDEKVKSFVRWVYISIIAFSCLLLLYQGWLGGVMVYEYGVGIIYQYVM